MGKFRPYPVPDDTPLFAIRRDLSGGANTRLGENVIGENQATVLSNVSLDTPAERSLRSGSTLIQALSSNAGVGLYGFEPANGAAELYAVQNGTVSYYAGSGAFANISMASLLATTATVTFTTAIESDNRDVLLLSNGTDDIYRILQDNTATDVTTAVTNPPPKSQVMTWYRDRLWVFTDEKLYYSGAVPVSTDYSFNTSTNYYNIPVGTEMAVGGSLGTGLFVFGTRGIYSVNPSIVPAPATDKTELILDIGCVAGNTVTAVGNDIFYFATDGIRGVFKTINERVSTGESYPISYVLKTEYDKINRTYLDKADAIYWDNKYIITLPYGSTNDAIWIYYPALNAWVTITGLTISRFAKVKFTNEEKLYGIDSNHGCVYRLFSGTADNSNAIVYNEESRAEDFGKPLQNKYGGEFKMKAKGDNCSVMAYGAVDGGAFTALDGDPIVLATGGFSFPLSFPVSFSTYEQTKVFHLDGLGKFKTIKFKIYCNALSANMKILESIATTFLDEYQPED